MNVIYEWSSVGAKYAGYVGKTKPDDRKICWFDSVIGDPLPDIAQWSVPTLVQYLGDGKVKRKPKKIGDSPFSIIPFVSQRAVDSLGDIFERHALLYPVKLDDAQDETYYMVVIKTVLDCLDRSQSIGKLQKYGPTPELFATVEKWVFDETCVGDADLFCLPDSNTTYYVSERFKQRVIDSKLKGFCLKTEFWEEKPWVS